MIPALLSAHRDGSLVAFGAAGDKTARALRIDAGRIARALPEPTPGSHVLLVFEGDRYAMVAALLATWHRGHAVRLPPSTRRDAIVALRDRPDTAAVVHDLGAGIPHRVADLLASPEGPPIDVRLPPRDVIATVHTSGTTAETSAWTKTAEQLLGEAAMLGAFFDVREGERLVATVSSNHIYGLLFGVLVPLLRGAAFSRESPGHAESIATTITRWEARRLVTVPLHVRALLTADPRALASVATVVSSTAPLSQDVADAFAARHGRAVTEILGSSETGGIAARVREAHARYVPFPGVRVETDAEQRLRVDSPFCDPAHRPFVTADLADLHADGTFTHLGRTDGIVKIAGRRVAVADIESFLRSAPGVDDAAVAAVPASEGREHQLVAAVVADESKLPELRARMLERFEPSVVPRRIIAVPELPREANGKLQRARLLRLFRLDAHGKPVNFALDWSEPTRGARVEDARETCAFTVEVPTNYAFYDGHFPGYPVLAGAVQLHELVLPAIARAFPGLGPVAELSGIKFTGRILPGDAVVVRVERERGREHVAFDIARDGTPCTSGRISFHAQATP